MGFDLISIQIYAVAGLMVLGLVGGLTFLIIHSLKAPAEDDHLLSVEENEDDTEFEDNDDLEDDFEDDLDDLDDDDDDDDEKHAADTQEADQRRSDKESMRKSWS